MPYVGMKDQVRILRDKFNLSGNRRWGKGYVGLPYPLIESEDETLNLVLAGKSIARYGDGELNLALGGSCISQREKSPALQSELRQVLASPGQCLVGIPNIYSETPKMRSWLNHA